MSVTVEYLGSGLTICRSMPASKVRGPLHVHSVTIVGSCETATTRSATGQTLPVAALVLLQATFALFMSGRLPETGQPTPAWGATALDQPDRVTRARVRAALAKARELAAHRRAEELHEK